MINYVYNIKASSARTMKNQITNYHVGYPFLNNCDFNINTSTSV